METLCEPPPQLLASLKRRYSERRRAYHTWAHVEALLRHFRAHQNLLNAPTTVLWALYWHDAIYDPASSENERNSAKLLRREANGLLPDEAIADAAAIIEATAGHHAPDGLPREKDADLKFFLDIDISIFGQTERAFDAYEDAIREEYSFVPLDIYKSGRAAILKGFLDREQLYLTGVFKDQWEEQARKNLRRSIRLLEVMQQRRRINCRRNPSMPDSPITAKIMGVVNATPDSFSDGGAYLDAGAAVSHALQLREDGADILDIGGESTRPGADDVPLEVELTRTIPVIEGVRKKGCAAEISIDTRKPDVARAAVAAGASIWNDVTALEFASDSLDVAASLSCDVVLMHAQGDPKTMQKDPHYDDVVEEVYAYLAKRIEACVRAGVDEARLIVDPGIGFGKTLDHNLALLAHLDRFCGLGRPVLLGASRKRFIAALDRGASADERLGGSLAAVMAGLKGGASIFRVHDVAETRQAISVFSAIESRR